LKPSPINSRGSDGQFKKANQPRGRCSDSLYDQGFGKEYAPSNTPLEKGQETQRKRGRDQREEGYFRNGVAKISVRPTARRKDGEFFEGCTVFGPPVSARGMGAVRAAGGGAAAERERSMREGQQKRMGRGRT